MQETNKFEQQALRSFKIRIAQTADYCTLLNPPEPGKKFQLVSLPTIRLSQYIQGQTCHGCIVIVGLCSMLLMRLCYYIYLGFGKQNRLTWESNMGTSDEESSLDQSANSDTVAGFFKNYWPKVPECFSLLGRSFI